MTVQEFRDQFEIEGDGKKIWCKTEGEFSDVIAALKDMGFKIYNDTENDFDEFPFLGYEDGQVIAWRSQIPEECFSYESFMEMYHLEYLGETEPEVEVVDEDPAEAEARFLAVLMPG